jgi:hypothetical protein
MLSKLLTLALTAAILAVVCFPASAHNGRLTNVLDEPVIDEQPWGGENQYSGPQILMVPSPDPGTYPGTLFFIKVTLDYGWFTITEYFLDTFSRKGPKTGNVTAQPIESSSTETQNNESGAGIR